VPEKRMQIGLSTSEDGLNWSKTIVAHDITTDCPNDAPGCLDKPMVAIGPDRKDPKLDVIYVFYFSEVTHGMRVTHSLDGGESFSPSTPVGNGGYGNATVTSSGKIHVAFVGGTESSNPMGDKDNAVWYTNSADGGNTFAAPVKITADNEVVPFFYSNPQIIADVPRKMLYSIYPAGGPDGKWDIMIASSADGGATWKRASVNDDGPCASQMVPTSALDSTTGKIHITWFENRSGQGMLAYATCQQGEKGIKCSANEMVSDTPFAAYSFARHSTKWLGEYNSVLIDEKRKIMHAVWTQTVDEGGTPVGRIFTSSAKLK
jgi:hypothetical protein